MTVGSSPAQHGRSGEPRVPVDRPDGLWAALELLRRWGYRVRHRLTDPGRSAAVIDHLAVGRAGILVLTDVAVAAAEPDHWDTDAGRARRAAVSVGALLPMPAALNTVPVLCVTGRRGLAGTLVGATSVVSPDRLADLVAALPERLSTADAVCVSDHLDLALRGPEQQFPGPRPGHAAAQAPAPGSYLRRLVGRLSR